LDAIKIMFFFSSGFSGSFFPPIGCASMGFGKYGSTKAFFSFLLGVSHVQGFFLFRLPFGLCSSGFKKRSQLKYAQYKVF